MISVRWAAPCANTSCTNHCILDLGNSSFWCTEQFYSYLLPIEELCFEIVNLCINA